MDVETICVEKIQDGLQFCIQYSARLNEFGLLPKYTVFIPSEVPTQPYYRTSMALGVKNYLIKVPRQ